MMMVIMLLVGDKQMSRYYNMVIKIDKYNADKSRVIISAVAEEWIIDLRNVDDPNERMLIGGEWYLCNGESEEEFADRVSSVIWKANDGFCNITVEAICLDDLPFETHIRNGEDYATWKNEIMQCNGIL